MTLRLNRRLNHRLPSLSKHLHGCLRDNFLTQDVVLLVQQNLKVRLPGKTVLV